MAFFLGSPLATDAFLGIYLYYALKLSGFRRHQMIPACPSSLFRSAALTVLTPSVSHSPHPCLSSCSISLRPFYFKECTLTSLLKSRVSLERFNSALCEYAPLNKPKVAQRREWPQLLRGEMLCPARALRTILLHF